MGQILHGSATTIEAIRRAIQKGEESLRAHSAHYGVNHKTVAKWRKRMSIADIPTGPKDAKSTVPKCASGGLLPKPQGNHATGKPGLYSAWLRDRLAVRGALTLAEILAELVAVQGVSPHRGSVGRWLHRLGPSLKKNAARPGDILRPEVAERRRVLD